jgi:DNA mismatch repair ATPase MutL
MVTEDRVINLEATLARFIEHTDLAIAEIRSGHARTDRQLLEMQQQADKERQQAEKNRQQEEKNRQQAEKNRQQDRQQAEKNRQQDRQQAEKDRQQAEKDRKDFNKRLAEISDSMGTLIEDMVAPCGFKLAKTVFGSEEAEACAIRVKRKHPARPGEMMELDLLAIGPAKLLVVEVKRRIDPAKVAEYRDKLKRFPEFFPELADKALCAAVASVYIESSVITFLNREKVYGIAMGDEVMEVINLGQF